MTADREPSAPPSVVLRRVLPFSPEDVFDAWLDPASLSEWMCPGPATRAVAVEVDARVGGAFLIEMDVEGHLETFRGTYRRIERPVRLDFSWTAGRTEGRVTEVTVTLDPHPAGVLLVLEHRGLPGPTAREEHRHGWTAILEMLGAHLGSG